MYEGRNCGDSSSAVDIFCYEKMRIEKFASRARAYICTYHHIEEERKKGRSSNDLDDEDVVMDDQHGAAAVKVKPAGLHGASHQVHYNTWTFIGL